MNFLKVSVCLSFAACLIFTAVCVVLSCLGYAIPDTLIEWFFKVFGTEFACAAGIKLGKYVIERQKIKDRVKLIKENGLEVEKDDLKAESDNNYYDYSYEGDETVG